eukprot:1150299-Amphidinium_carterae.2
MLHRTPRLTKKPREIGLPSGRAMAQNDASLPGPSQPIASLLAGHLPPIPATPRPPTPANFPFLPFHPLSTTLFLWHRILVVVLPLTLRHAAVSCCGGLEYCFGYAPSLKRALTWTSSRLRPCGFLVSASAVSVPSDRSQEFPPSTSTKRPIPDDWPSWDVIHRSPSATRKSLPKGAKALWSQCLTGALAQVVVYNDEKAWTELYMLPRAVLIAPSRGGSNHRKRAKLDTRDRCRRRLEGQRGELWVAIASRRNKAQAVQKALSLHEKMCRAEELLVEGMLTKKACAALVEGQIAQPTAEVVVEMVKKHPRARTGEPDEKVRSVQAAAAGSGP